MFFDNETSFHDSILEKMEVNYENRSVDLRISYYEGIDDGERRSAIISFKNVERVVSSVNMILAKDNFQSGNVNYISLQEDGVFNLHIMEGILQIFSLEFDISYV